MLRLLSTRTVMLLKGLLTDFRSTQQLLPLTAQQRTLGKLRRSSRVY